MSKPPRTCAAGSCSAEVDRSTPFCRRHWDKLPGKLRSSISLAAAAKGSATRDEQINRAVRLLGTIA